MDPKGTVTAGGPGQPGSGRAAAHIGRTGGAPAPSAPVVGGSAEQPQGAPAHGRSPGDPPQAQPRSARQHVGGGPQAAGSAEPRERSAGPRGQRLERFGERTEDFVDTFESAIGQAVPRRVQSRRDPRQSTVVNVIWRAAVLVAGVGLLIVGAALLVLPGPGWGTILLGLAVLASEYTWANRLLGPVRRRMRREASRVRGLSHRQQAAIFVVVGLGAVVSLVWTSWFLANADWTWLPW